MTTTNRHTALITGGSTGLGHALTRTLASDGWQVITDARNANALTDAFSGSAHVVPVAGDITSPDHRRELVASVRAAGRLDLLVHNASTLGASPLPRLSEIDPIVLDDIWLTNVAAPVALTQSLLPHLRASRGTLVGISSDAAVEHYPTWGGYAASKAALDHAILTFGAEEEAISAYALDPGDMRTAMHQAAFPGEDISDRPLPESVVGAFTRLITHRPADGRYRLADYTDAQREGAA